MNVFDSYYDVRYAIADWRRARRLRRSLNIQVGDFVSDCNYRILAVTAVSYADDDLRGIDVTTGIEYSCSLEHCGVERLNIAHVRSALRSLPDRTPSHANEQALWVAEHRRIGHPWSDAQVAAYHNSFTAMHRRPGDYADASPAGDEALAAAARWAADEAASSPDVWRGFGLVEDAAGQWQIELFAADAAALAPEGSPLPVIISAVEAPASTDKSG